MSKPKEYYDFKAKVIEEREKSFNLEVITPDKYKDLQCWTAKSLIETYQITDNIITGKIINWCFASKVKEKEKKEEKSEETKSEAKAGVPSVVNVNLDTSNLVGMLNLIIEQISGLASQIIEVKELLKPKKSTKAKPKSQPTEANS